MTRTFFSDLRYFSIICSYFKRPTFVLAAVFISFLNRYVVLGFSFLLKRSLVRCLTMYEFEGIELAPPSGLLTGFVFKLLKDQHEAKEKYHAFTFSGHFWVNPPLMKPRHYAHPPHTALRTSFKAIESG